MASQTFNEAQERDFTYLTIFLANQRRVEGYFANIRIDRRTVPEGWHVYDMRDDDSNGEPCELKNGYIRVNHFGTFATEEDLGLADGESLYISEDEENPQDGEFNYSW